MSGLINIHDDTYVRDLEDVVDDMSSEAHSVMHAADALDRLSLVVLQKLAPGDYLVEDLRRAMKLLVEDFQLFERSIDPGKLLRDMGVDVEDSPALDDDFFEPHF